MAEHAFEHLRLFLSYAEEDHRFVSRLERHLSALIAQGKISLWKAQEDIRGGEVKEEAIASHIQQAHIVLLLLSPDYIYEPECRIQMELALKRRREAEHKIIVIPIILSPCDWKSLNLDDLQCLPRNKLPITISETEKPGQAFQEIADEIRRIVSEKEHQEIHHKDTTARNGIELRPLPSLVVRRENPYVGLRAFEFDDARYFHGREHLIQEICSHLYDLVNTRGEGHRLIAIVGSSGSGKSSVVNAGILPQIVQGNLPNSESWILLRTLRLTKSPIGNLINILLDHLPRNTSRTKMRETLLTSDNELRYLVSDIMRNHQPQQARQIPVACKVVLVIDQFEELFTVTDAEEQRAFIANLVNAVTSPERDSPSDRYSYFPC